MSYHISKKTCWHFGTGIVAFLLMMAYVSVTPSSWLGSSILGNQPQCALPSDREENDNALARARTELTENEGAHTMLIAQQKYTAEKLTEAQQKSALLAEKIIESIESSEQKKRLDETTSRLTQALLIETTRKSLTETQEKVTQIQKKFTQIEKQHSSLKNAQDILEKKYTARTNIQRLEDQNQGGKQPTVNQINAREKIEKLTLPSERQLRERSEVENLINQRNSLASVAQKLKNAQWRQKYNMISKLSEQSLAEYQSRYKNTTFPDHLTLTQLREAAKKYTDAVNAYKKTYGTDTASANELRERLQVFQELANLRKAYLSLDQTIPSLESVQAEYERAQENLTAVQKEYDTLLAQKSEQERARDTLSQELTTLEARYKELYKNLERSTEVQKLYDTAQKDYDTLKGQQKDLQTALTQSQEIIKRYERESKENARRIEENTTEQARLKKLVLDLTTEKDRLLAHPCPSDETGLCENGIDDNRDGLADCGDKSCWGTASCQNTTCGDGIVQQPNGQGVMEQCEPGLSNAQGSCNSLCQLTNTNITCASGYTLGANGACVPAGTTTGSDDGDGGDGQNTCGDTYCDADETYESCPVDCPDDTEEDRTTDDSPKTEFGCTDPYAHNYNGGALNDDGSCETCNDRKQNGDEKGIDCEGICGNACVLGCMNPTAINYKPNATKDDGTCISGEPIDDSGGGGEPAPVCDIPSAVNFCGSGCSGISDPSLCNFCGNGIQEGEGDSHIGLSGNTAFVTPEECDDGNDIPYDGCYQCRLELCDSEAILCATKKKELDKKKSKSKDVVRSVYGTFLPGFDGPRYANSDTTRGEWADGTLDIYADMKYSERKFSTFGSVCVSEKGKKNYEYTGDHTEFGFADPIDNGWGTPALGTGCIRCSFSNGGNNHLSTSSEGSIGTNNPYIRGVAIPQSILNEIIGTNLSEQRQARVEVSYYDPITKITTCRSFPIVDYGPGEYVYARACHAVIDMTKKAAEELGIQGKSHQIPLIWNIIPKGGKDPNTGQKSGRITLPDDYFNVTNC